jgi:hypothetical protein
VYFISLVFSLYYNKKLIQPIVQALAILRVKYLLLKPFSSDCLKWLNKLSVSYDQISTLFDLIIQTLRVKWSIERLVWCDHPSALIGGIIQALWLVGSFKRFVSRYVMWSYLLLFYVITYLLCNWMYMSWCDLEMQQFDALFSSTWEISFYCPKG